MNLPELNRRVFLRSAGAGIGAVSLLGAGTQQPLDVTRISVDATRAQRFEGFGLSQPRGDKSFAALDDGVQREALDRVYKDLPVRFFRAWVRAMAAWDVPRMMRDFEESYLDNGMLAKISARCHPSFLLAPGTLDEWPTTPAPDYGRKIAEFLATLRAQRGVVFEATGILNEPNVYPDWYLIEAITSLRRELDRRGLQGTQIVAADWANVSNRAIDSLLAIEADPQANAAVFAWSTHSYNMASTPAMAAAARKKQRWVTEAGQGVGDSEGSVTAVNAMDAPAVAGRFLADLNLGATRWMYFIGLLNSAFLVGSGRSKHALVVASNSNGTFAYNRYYYLKQLLATFPLGSVVHACNSSTEKSMEWTYGQKPKLTVACAEGPDGRLRLAAVNTTGITSDKIAQYHKTQEISFKLDLPWSRKTFNTFVTGSDAITRTAGSIRAGNGDAILTLQPLELLTLIEGD